VFLLEFAGFQGVRAALSLALTKNAQKSTDATIAETGAEAWKRVREWNRGGVNE